jgi:3-hydroxyisobutyrate dehydrogenase-like beta-hydroxyacid dehydrogenase
LLVGGDGRSMATRLVDTGHQAETLNLKQRSSYFTNAT